MSKIRFCGVYWGHLIWKPPSRALEVEKLQNPAFSTSSRDRWREDRLSLVLSQRFRLWSLMRLVVLVLNEEEAFSSLY